MTETKDTLPINPKTAFGEKVDPEKPKCLHLAMKPIDETKTGLYVSKCSDCGLEMTSHVAPKEK